MLFSVYVDDLIRFLRHSGYGTYIGSQFIGTILYADDITLLSGSCRGLQRMLDICAEFGHKWDKFCFNAKKSQTLTLGGHNPDNCHLLLDSRPLQWVNKVKSVCGNNRNELVSLHLVKSYCLPRLLYGCEGISFSVLQLHELNVIRNNAFRCIFNCCWRESVKPLQFLGSTL